MKQKPNNSNASSRFSWPGAKTSRAALTSLLVLAAGLFVGAPGAQAAAPNAGDNIGNIATATYVDGGGTSRSANSLTVNTTVEQVAAVQLTANQTLPGSPGQGVTFTHNLKNIGNGTDTFDLTAVNIGGDDFDFTTIQIFLDADKNGIADGPAITQVVGLGRDDDVNLLIIAGVPGSALDTDTGQLTLTATSAFDNGQSASNTDTVNVTGNANITVNKVVIGAANGPAGGPTEFTFQFNYDNVGIGTATNVVFSDIIPAGLSYVADSARWSVSGATVLTDADDGEVGTFPNTIKVDFGVTAAGTLTARVNQVAPQDNGTITFKVTIDAGTTPGPISNTVNLTYHDGSNNVGPFVGGPATITVDAVSAVTLGDDTIALANQGATLVFDNLLTNDGNITDTFDLTIDSSTFPAGTQIDFLKPDGVTLQTDSGGTTAPDTGPVGPGLSVSVKIRVILPPNMKAADAPANFVKRATSVADPTKFDTGTDTLTAITDNSVDLTNGSVGGPGAGDGPEPAAVTTNTLTPSATLPVTTSFSLFVENTSGVSDSYGLAASTDNTFTTITMPAGWSVVFKIAGTPVTTTGNIGPGANVQVIAEVTVPAGQTPVTQSVFFRARSASSNTEDIKHDAVTVNRVRSISLTPNNTGQIFPNGTATYAHTLENTGNVNEGDGTVSSIALTLGNNQPGFTSVVYHDANNNGIIDAGDVVVTTLDAIGPIVPGQQVPLLVRVFADNTVTAPTVNTTTITATTTNGTYVDAVPAVVLATDQSTVVEGDVTVTKLQALDADENNVADAAFQAANLTAPPGRVILYQIKVKNTGTGTVTTVVLSDTVPTHTTYLNGGVYAAATDVGTITVEPANGAVAPAALTVTVGSLTSLQEATITFAVRVNQ